MRQAQLPFAQAPQQIEELEVADGQHLDHWQGQQRHEEPKQMRGKPRP